jgi:hypothetical protein
VPQILQNSLAVRCKVVIKISGKNVLKKSSFFYNRQKNVTFMYRYQVATYAIFDSEKNKNFTKIKKFKNFSGCRKNSVCISCKR